MNKMLAPIRLTSDQHKWVEDEAKRLGESKSTIIRLMIDRDRLKSAVKEEYEAS